MNHCESHGEPSQALNAFPCECFNFGERQSESVGGEKRSGSSFFGGLFHHFSSRASCTQSTKLPEVLLLSDGPVVSQRSLWGVGED